MSAPVNRRLTDEEASLLGALSPEKAEAHRRGERIQVTAEEAAYFRHQFELQRDREFEAMRQDVRRFREALVKCRTAIRGEQLEHMVVNHPELPQVSLGEWLDTLLA